MNGSGPLDFDATINQRQFNLALDQMMNRIRGVGDQAEKEGAKIDQSFRNAAAAVTAYFSASFVKNMVTEIGQVRGEFQQLEIAFETILKNKQKSDALMKDIVQFAAKTPFDLKGVATGAKQLLAYGTSVEDIIPTMRRLGDIAAGLSIPFGDLVYLYGTSATQGRIMTKDLMQFAGRGIPVIEELSKILGVSKSEILDLASEGVLSFEMLEEVIFNLTKATGMFGGMMEKQSASITGLASNLGDAWDTMLNKIGEANQSTFEGALKTAIELVENYEVVLDILKVLVATYGTYRAAVIINTVAMKGYSSALGLAVIKQNLLNLAQKASPWGLALAGVTALIGGLWAYNRSLNKSRVELNENSESMIKQSFETEKLISKLKNANISAEERKKVLEELKQVNPEVTEAIKSEATALEDVIKKYNELNLIKRANLSVEAFKVDNNFSEIKKGFEEAQVDLEQESIRLESVWVKIWDDFQTKANDSTQTIPKYVKKIFDEIVEEGLGAEQAIKKINDAYNDVAIKRSQFGKQNVSSNNNELYEYFYDIRKAFDIVNYSSTLNSFNQANESYKKSLSSLEAYIDSYTSSLIALSEAEKEELNIQLKREYIPNFQVKGKQELDAVEEQLTVTQKIASLRKEIAEQQKQLQQLKSPESIYDSKKIKETEESISSLKKELESIVGAGAKKDKKTFSETISDIKQTYENYYKWAKNYGKEAADEQFKNLVSGGQSFLEYLEKEISKYESKAQKTSTDRDNLSVLWAAKDDVLGNKTQIDAFKEQIDQAKEEYRDLIDYIEFLKRTITSQGEWDGSEQSMKKLNFLYQELSSSEREFARQSQDTYSRLMQDAGSYAQKRMQIEQEYNANIAKLDEKSLGADKFKEAMEAAKKLREEQIAALAETELKSSEAYQKLSGDISKLTRGEAQKYLNILKSQLTTLEDQPELYAKIEAFIKSMSDQLNAVDNENLAEGLYMFADSLAEITQNLDGVNDNFKQILSTVGQLVGQMGNVVNNLKIDPVTGGFTNAFGGASGIIGMMFSTANLLDKQFGIQKSIAKTEEERIRYQQQQVYQSQKLKDELQEQLRLISQMAQGQQFDASTNALEQAIFENRRALDEFKFTAQSVPDFVKGKVKISISDIVDMTGIQDEYEALAWAVQNGKISNEDYQIALEYLNAIKDAQLEIEEIERRQAEYLTGTSVEGMTSEIMSMFREGRTEAEDFAAYFEELMKEAMLQSLKMKALEGPMQNFFDQFATASEDGLSSDEVDHLRDVYNQIMDDANQQFNDLMEIFGSADEMPTADTSLTGAIKGVSEETAGLIAGQMNAIRMNQAQSLVALNSMLEHLSGIEFNTRNNVYIRRIYDLLESRSNDDSINIRANGGY